MKYLFSILAISLALWSCEIREEYTFNKDGSGEYQLAFDMSELMSMDLEPDSTKTEQAVDTLIIFADMLEEKKDSISQLSAEEQAKLEKLRPLKMRMIMNDSTKQMNINLNYAFKKVEDLQNFDEAVAQADVKELNDLTSAGKQGDAEAANDSIAKEPESDIFDMASSFDTKFTKKKFTHRITEEARLEAVQQKDTAMKADDSFADMVRFKQVFRFPYRVKSVDNENAKILSDFMGVEVEANMYQLNNNPDFFNLEVVFEK